jgi:hypothetical protein
MLFFFFLAPVAVEPLFRTLCVGVGVVYSQVQPDECVSFLLCCVLLLLFRSRHRLKTHKKKKTRVSTPKQRRYRPPTNVQTEKTALGNADQRGDKRESQEKEGKQKSETERRHRDLTKRQLRRPARQLRRRWKNNAEERKVLCSNTRLQLQQKRCTGNLTPAAQVCVCVRVRMFAAAALLFLQLSLHRVLACCEHRSVLFCLFFACEYTHRGARWAAQRAAYNPALQSVCVLCSSFFFLFFS